MQHQSLNSIKQIKYYKKSKCYHKILPFKSLIVHDINNSNKIWWSSNLLSPKRKSKISLEAIKILTTKFRDDNIDFPALHVSRSPSVAPHEIYDNITHSLFLYEILYRSASSFSITWVFYNSGFVDITNFLCFH